MTDSMRKLKKLTKRLKIAPVGNHGNTSGRTCLLSPTFVYPSYTALTIPSPTGKGKPLSNDVFMTSPKRRLSSTKSVPLSPFKTNEKRESEQIGDLQMKLDGIIAELLAMKMGDEDLARKLMTLHSEIHALKVSNSYVKNGELLDEAIHEAEVASAGPRISDEPRKAINKVLLERGVTRMNLWTRRFSCA